MRAQNKVLAVAPQNLMEFWAAATRPFDENELGLSIEQVTQEIEHIKRFWVVLPDVPLFGEWERLVKNYRVAGKNSHDARLVAAMRVRGIRSILTFNVKDFVRFDGLEVLDPALFR